VTWAAAGTRWRARGGCWSSRPTRRPRRAPEAWIEEQRGERPELQCFLLVEHEGQELFMAIQGAIDRERPDAIVMVRHAGESHWAHEGTYGRLTEEQRVPVDAIFVGAEAKA
jgi:hypothetical protein